MAELGWKASTWVLLYRCIAQPCWSVSSLLWGKCPGCSSNKRADTYAQSNLSPRLSRSFERQENAHPRNAGQNSCLSPLPLFDVIFLRHEFAEYVCRQIVYLYPSRR